jgi:hypothetical protein
VKPLAWYQAAVVWHGGDAKAGNLKPHIVNADPSVDPEAIPATLRSQTGQQVAEQTERERAGLSSEEMRDPLSGRLRRRLCRGIRRDAEISKPLFVCVSVRGVCPERKPEGKVFGS